jgi:hypothetical protein
MPLNLCRVRISLEGAEEGWRITGIAVVFLYRAASLIPDIETWSRIIVPPGSKDLDSKPTEDVEAFHGAVTLRNNNDGSVLMYTLDSPNHPRSHVLGFGIFEYLVQPESGPDLRGSPGSRPT